MRILLIGHGRMGQMLEECIAAAEDLTLAGAVNSKNIDTLATLEDVADVAIDFSSPAVLPQVAEFVRRTGTPLPSCATLGRLRRCFTAQTMRWAWQSWRVRCVRWPPC